MSPLGKKKPKKAARKTPKQREVKSGDRSGKVIVTPYVGVDGMGDTITVQWVCGGSRTFTPPELEQSIKYIDSLGAEYELWLNLEDRSNQRFYVRLKQGKLTANDYDNTENGLVSWYKLKQACQGALKDLA